jgi:signal transduction histidine kinase
VDVLRTFLATLRRRFFVADLVAAMALTLVTWAELAANRELVDEFAGQVAAFTAMTGSVAFRRRAPLPAAGVVAAAMAIQTLLGEAPVVGGFVALLVVLYSAGAHLDGSRSVVALAMLLGSTAVYPVVEPAARNVPDAIGNLVILAGTWGLGCATRYHQSRERLLTEAQAELRARHELDKRAALVAERARIARELHDVVAHGVTLMLVQSGAARLHLDRSPERAREPLLVIEAAGRQALEDLQHMLGVLRLTEAAPAEGGDADTGTGLQRIEQVVEHTRAAGLAVDLHIDGDTALLPAALEHCAHRIVQESLTNAIKHANAGHATVRLSATHGTLDIEVRDDGRGRSQQAPVPSSGFGLDGLRERVSLYGGQMTAGPLPEGGWRVRAALPHHPAPAPARS